MTQTARKIEPMPVHSAKIRLAAAVLGLAATTGATAAATLDYVGVWSQDTGNCSKPQEHAAAPMAVTAKGYDQHETHCRFATVRRLGLAWQIGARCTVEGNLLKDTFTMAVDSDRLTIRRGANTTTLTRCR